MLQQRLQELKSILNYQLRLAIQNVNREFTSAPIDTGLMLDTTELVSVSVNIEDFKILLNIRSQDYLKYVENGWGSNSSYGQRRVREVAINHPDSLAAQSNLMAEMYNQYLNLGSQSSAIRNIKINI